MTMPLPSLAGKWEYNDLPESEKEIGETDVRDGIWEDYLIDLTMTGLEGTQASRPIPSLVKFELGMDPYNL